MGRPEISTRKPDGWGAPRIVSTRVTTFPVVCFGDGHVTCGGTTTNGPPANYRDSHHHRLSMRPLISILKNNFVFTGERHVEIEFFQNPIFKSAYFKSDTASMIVSLGFGSFTLAWYWWAIPTSARTLLIAVLAYLPSIWLRTIADHARLRKALAQVSVGRIPADLLVRASGVSLRGPSLVYAVVFVLFLSLSFTIHSHQHILSMFSK